MRAKVWKRRESSHVQQMQAEIERVGDRGAPTHMARLRAKAGLENSTLFIDPAQVKARV